MSAAKELRSAENSVEFEAAGDGMTLTSAILLYSGGTTVTSQHAPAFASIHSVEHSPDGPVIAAGRPLTHQHLRRWAGALGRNAPPEILPANVIAAHHDLLAWWVPEQVRPAHFDLSSPPAGLKALAEKTTIAVPYPAHLFVATRAGLAVFALPANARPAADTPVLHSPVLNVFLGGQLCWGNIAKPKALSVAAMAEYERAVFDSWSTHPNAGQDQTVTGKRGLVRLWDDLAARQAKRFPVRRLKTFFPQQRRPADHRPITVAQIIEWAC